MRTLHLSSDPSMELFMIEKLKVNTTLEDHCKIPFSEYYKIPAETNFNVMNLDLPDNLGSIKSDIFKITNDIFVFKNTIKTQSDLIIQQEDDRNLTGFVNMGVVVEGIFEGAFSDDKADTFGKHQMLLSYYKNSDGYMKLRKEVGVKTLNFMIRKEFLLENIPNLRLTINSQLASRKLVSKNIFLAQSIFNMSKNEPFYSLKIQNMASEFLLEEFVQLQGEVKALANFSKKDLLLLQEAREILLENLEPMTISELARTVGINEFKLKSGFKELFKTTVHQASLAHRLQVAQNYLATTDLSIGEIANKVGFKSQQNFTTAFKKQTACLPKDYKSAIQPNPTN